MIFKYKFDLFSIGLYIPIPFDSFIVSEFQLINLDMSNIVSPTVSETLEDIFLLDQVHGNDVVLINGKEIKIFYHNSENTESIPFDSSLSGKIKADAVISTSKVKCGIKTADCVPILFFYDNTVGAIHAGWRGLKNDVIGKTIKILENLKIRLEFQKMKFFILPSINVCCYEVGEEFLEWARDFCIIKENKVFFDMTKYITTYLLSQNVTEENIYYSPLCTGCHSNILPSYRFNKTEKRMISFIYLH